MSDLISRQAAIEICDDELLHSEYYSPIRTWNRILQLPSAQPERKKGKWERYGHDFFGDNEYRCTACEKTANIKTAFCPNCGADMRGEEDETD